MNSHYIVIADHGHLRIFTERTSPGQSTPTLVEVHSMDFPHARASYADSDTDMAGRFQSSQHQGRGPGTPTARTGMSIDERLPMAREAERRQNDDIAKGIESFLSQRPDATWDFAAGPSTHNAVLDRLAPQLKGRLKTAVSKNLVNQPVQELLGHFAQPARSA